MEAIVQLRKSEYDTLVESASLSIKNIERKAQELYEENGTFAIKIELDVQENYHSDITFKASSYVKDWDNKFPISDDDKRKIVKFVNYKAKDLLVRKFGKQIANVNFYNDEIKKLNIARNSSMIFTITGWLAALTLVLISILK